MLNMSSWPEMQLDVLADLHLDPKNVRLETPSNAIEADILEDLFVNENALALVEGIAKIGYLTHEVPIALKRQGKYIVVEGNRRVAALKVIQNPMLVPEFQSRITAFASAIPDKKALRKISVKMAPNQTQADQLIAALHTTNARRAWTPARQAAFFQAQIDAGRTYKQLLTRYPLVDVPKFVLRGHVVNLFKAADYDSPELHDYLKTAKWKRGLSTLARIYESKEFQALTGLSMDDNGKLSLSISDETFSAVANVIVRDMYEESINTRSLNKVGAPRFVQLMSEVRPICEGNGAAPSTPAAEAGKAQSKAENPVSASGGGADAGTAKGGTTAPSKPPPKSKLRFLNLSQHAVPASYPQAMTTLMAEMSAVNIQTMPNVAFITMRAVLERAIKSFAEEKQIEIKKPNNTNGYIQLKDALLWLLAYVKDKGPKVMEQPIMKVLGGNLVNFGTSANALNAANHNHHFSVESDEVIQMWGSIDSIVRFALKP